MPKRQFILWWLLAGSLLTACGTPIAAKDQDLTASPSFTTAPPTPLLQFPPDDCPVTRPPDPAFVPPDPYPPVAPYGEFWYGSDDLWVLMHPDGRWYALPRDEHGYGQKVFWFRKGYDMTTEQRPDITIRGRRLDGDGATFEQTGATNGHHPDIGMFMLTGVTIPAAGCWEITGVYNKTSLSFVVWVAPR